MKSVDLHTHTSKSDGSYTPTRLVDYAIEKGLLAVAITDHDSIEGLDEALSHAASLKAQGLPSVEVVPGIEFSTKYEKQDVHIVGLYISYDSDAFRTALDGFVNSRVNRNIKMCQNLREAGIDISYEKLQAMYPEAVITRAHYAAYLLENGYVKSRQDAFAMYLGDHTKYFVPREKVTPTQAIKLILTAGGDPYIGSSSSLPYGKGQAGYSRLLLKGGRADGNRSVLQHLHQPGCAGYDGTCQSI